MTSIPTPVIQQLYNKKILVNSSSNHKKSHQYHKSKISLCNEMDLLNSSDTNQDIPITKREGTTSNENTNSMNPERSSSNKSNGTIAIKKLLGQSNSSSSTKVNFHKNSDINVTQPWLIKPNNTQKILPKMNAPSISDDDITNGSEPGETLDKIFGGNFKVIDIFNGEAVSNEAFPNDPKKKNKQKNFDILEADEEDELVESIVDNNNNNNNIVPCDIQALKSINIPQHQNNHSDSRDKTQDMNLNLDKRSIRISTSRRSINKTRDSNTAYEPQIFQRTRARKLINSQSPAEMKKHSMNITTTSRGLNESFSPFKQRKRNDSTNKTFNTTNTINYLANETCIQEFNSRPIVSGSNLTDDIKTQGINKKNSSDNQDMPICGPLKGNKFFNQKSIIDAKFKNEDDILMYKYASRFSLYEQPELTNSNCRSSLTLHLLSQKSSNTTLKSMTRKMAALLHDPKQEPLNKSKIKLNEASKN